MLVKGMHLNVWAAISASSVETILGNFAHRLSLVPLCTNPKLNILHNWELWQDHVYRLYLTDEEHFTAQILCKCTEVFMCQCLLTRRLLMICSGYLLGVVLCHLAYLDFCYELWQRTAILAVKNLFLILNRQRDLG
jgi:hypothetical protein